MKKWLYRSLAGVVVLGAAAQAVPYGRDHTNPAVVAEPSWSDPGLRALAVRACYDCHSNESRWPWYSNVAPVSWLVQSDVVEGRQALNFSEWNRPQKEASEAAKATADQEMPPAMYVPLHAESRLSAVERERLVRGLSAITSTDPSSARRVKCQRRHNRTAVTTARAVAASSTATWSADVPAASANRSTTKSTAIAASEPISSRGVRRCCSSDVDPGWLGRLSFDTRLNSSPRSLACRQVESPGEHVHSA